jgi:hypothetical protein
MPYDGRLHFSHISREGFVVTIDDEESAKRIDRRGEDFFLQNIFRVRVSRCNLHGYVLRSGCCVKPLTTLINTDQSTTTVLLIVYQITSFIINSYL